MRITFVLLFFVLVSGLFLWVTLSGALFVVGCLLLASLIVITVGYSDIAILFFLGAREVKSSDESAFHAAAAQEAYKLAVSQPRLYFYNGALERAFVLQNKKNISLVLSKELLEICTKEELSAICFELLIQVKKNLANKRTKVMFVAGFSSWLLHSFFGFLLRLVPVREFRMSMNWGMNFLLQPWLVFLFKLTLGKKYFKKLESLLKHYPHENDLLQKVGTKLRRPREIYSLPSKKLIELSSVKKSHHFQNILSLEVLPHEWDVLFDSKAGLSA